MINYEYDVRIGRQAKVLRTAEFAETIPDATDLAITSTLFNNFEECQAALGRLLSTLASRESQAAQENFVIVSKTNPKLVGGKGAEKEEWADKIVVKLFIANAEMLKKSVLHYVIDGRISLSQNSLTGNRISEDFIQ